MSFLMHLCVRVPFVSVCRVQDLLCFLRRINTKDIKAAAELEVRE